MFPFNDRSSHSYKCASHHYDYTFSSSNVPGGPLRFKCNCPAKTNSTNSKEEVNPTFGSNYS